MEHLLFLPLRLTSCPGQESEVHSEINIKEHILTRVQSSITAIHAESFGVLHPFLSL